MAAGQVKLRNLLKLEELTALEMISYLQGLGLLARYYSCPNCNINMTLSERQTTKDKYCWRCSKCRSTRTVRKGSWFANSNLSFAKVLQMTYLWVRETSHATVHGELDVSKPTVVDWYNFWREVCTEIVLNTQEAIGGPGMIVEIDESKFGKRKYNRGKRVDGKWVFGGVERGTNRCFLKVVEDRSAGTLVGVIKENILPGTTIISDCWKAYNSLDESYAHLTVNHSVTFKDPETGAHTNTCEGMWSLVKRRLPLCNRASGMFSSYLSEFMYRRRRTNSSDLFLDFLRDVAAVYPPYTCDIPEKDQEG